MTTSYLLRVEMKHLTHSQMLSNRTSTSESFQPQSKSSRKCANSQMVRFQGQKLLINCQPVDQTHLLHKEIMHDNANKIHLSFQILPMVCSSCVCVCYSTSKAFSTSLGGRIQPSFVVGPTEVAASVVHPNERT